MAALRSTKGRLTQLEYGKIAIKIVEDQYAESDSCISYHGLYFPVFAQISRDEMTIYLTEHTGDCQVGGLIHFFVPNLDTWYSELKGKINAHIIEAPSEDLEGLRMMTVLDPDRNQLRICTQLEV
ncbi:glyoxalase superfamily protein [Paenibacillus sp. LHD-38]|uniref:glyoxalase superfamily protein n=1 Tax=Paenibacillus sp. LHD-38 TaxID=3072143 RepID=UPI00280CBDD0|nr:glyoxalase superfamily protein [Paenibacillus sp. LHD-38]MDQ8738836.1 glyoxalase superfamily protein [Paenibacillus sp. LHD-38]